jgi:hypothetical protein
MTQHNGVDPLAHVQPIALPLTPTEFGVVVALTGLGMSAMAGNVPMGKQYQGILSDEHTEAVAFSAFEKLVAALETVTGEAA